MARLTGGPALEAALAQLDGKMRGPKTVAVGFLEDATYPDGTPVALVAAANNFGAPSQGVPPRPFFSNMVREKSPTWANSLATVLKTSDYDPQTALELMGEGIAGQLRASIQATNSPPLAPATIARKGFEKPLIDTSNMWMSIDKEVRDE